MHPALGLSAPLRWCAAVALLAVIYDTLRACCLPTVDCAAAAISGRFLSARGSKTVVVDWGALSLAGVESRGSADAVVDVLASGGELD